MEVILYSTGCPQCNILKEMLQKKNIIFQIEDNVEKMKELGFSSLPMLSIDNKILNFKEAFNFLKNEVNVNEH